MASHKEEPDKRANEYVVIGKGYESELEKRDGGKMITCDITAEVPPMGR